jgi:DHA1 family bicyclomycin/chloramphenicol resistance-like MFS transporter
MTDRCDPGQALDLARAPLLTAPPRRFSRIPGLSVLVLVTMSGTFPIHSFVPALPALAHEFGGSPGEVQLTITLYILGLSFGQLLYGPLSDRYGRRPVLLFGLAFYFLGSVACAMATSLSFLIGARVIQALGGCAGLVLGRVIARDSAGPAQVVRSLSTLGIVMSVAPALAPILGAQLTQHFGWRGVFYMFSILSAGVLAMIVLTLAETCPEKRVDKPLESFLSYGKLLQSRKFLGNAIGGACATTSFYAFVAVSPFIFLKGFGVSATVFGLIYVGVVVSLSAGYSSANFLSGKLKSATILHRATVIMIIAALVIVAACAFKHVTVLSISLPMMAFMFGTGLASPYAVTGAINAEPNMVGAASGMYGFIQMTFGALCTVAAGTLPAHPEVSMGVVLFVSACLSLLAFRAAHYQKIQPS